MKNKIFFLCPYIEWEKPNSGGLFYNYVFIKALKKHYGDDVVVPLNLIGDGHSLSWGKRRIIANLKYLKFLLGGKLRKSDLVLVDSRANSLLILPLLFVHFFSKATIGVIVHHIYYHLSDRQGFFGIIEKFSEKQFVRYASFVITNSRSTKNGIIKLTGRPESIQFPIQIVSPGLKTGSGPGAKKRCFVRSSSELKLLYVGSCEDPRKGLDCLIHAIAGLPSSHFKLYLVGKYDKTNSYYQHLSRCVEEKKINRKVQFFGRVSDEKLKQLYCESDIFVFPSLWEGYGIVLAEAMAHGLPVVATDISSIPEIVQNGVNGILVPPGSVESLTEALAELMDSDELRGKMADKSIEIADDFKSWDEVGRILVQCIDKLFVGTEPIHDMERE